MKKLEKEILKHLQERGWDNLRPADISKSIMIEGAELLELFQWENLSLEQIKKNREKVREIGKELADVLIYSFELAVLLNLDTRKIIEEKLEYVRKKYPAELMKKNAKRHSGSGKDKEYWRIKKGISKKRELTPCCTLAKIQ